MKHDINSCLSERNVVTESTLLQFLCFLYKQLFSVCNYNKQTVLVLSFWIEGNSFNAAVVVSGNFQKQLCTLVFMQISGTNLRLKD